MKKIILLIFATFIFSTTFAQTTWDFAFPIQTTETSAQWTDEWISNTVKDNEGNIYVMGETWAEELTIGNETLTGQGGSDVFMLKYDQEGEIQWVKFFAGDGDETFPGIVVDNENDFLYVVGGFGSTTMDFGNGIALTNDGNNFKAVLAKFDLDGNAIWAKDAESGDGCGFSDVALNSNKQPVLVGSFSGEYLYIEDETVTNTYPDFGAEDIFIATYNTNGDLVSLIETDESGGGEICSAIEIDNNDNIFIAGKYGTSVRFGNVAFSDEIVGSQLFLMKFSPQGEVQWGKTATNDGYCDPYRTLKCDGENIYAYLLYQGPTFEFEGQTYINENENTDDLEAIVTKLDNDGNVVWTYEVNGTLAGNVTGSGFGSIDISSNQELILSGAFYGTSIQFGDFTLSNPSTVSGYAGFVVKLNQEGSPIHAELIGNEYFASATNVNLDFNNNIDVTGIYLIEPQTFGEYTLPNTGSWDSFFAKLSGLPNSYITTFEVTDGINPIENAEITVGETTKQTNENGIAEFYFLPNDYEYQITATGYQTIDATAFSITDQNETITVQMTAEVSVSEIKDNISIYPNPTTGIINLSGFQSTDTMPCVSTVKITDITGKQIQNIQYSTQNNQYSFDLSELENGLYFIKIEKEGNIYTQKIVKY